jgi:hypothetical protein
MAGPLPKPPEQRRRRNRTSFTGVDLPASGRPEPAPKLPNWRDWDRRTLKWWRNLWSSPPATQWDPSGPTLWVYAVLMDMLITEQYPAHRLSPELRAWEDRYGLSPKALATLRWQVVDELPKEPVRVTRYARLRAVDPDLAAYAHLADNGDSA